jgi:hypothetical protein
LIIISHESPRSVGGGFVVNEKTKGKLTPRRASILVDLSIVDENLYYKGINKSDVDPSRLSQQYDGDPEHPGPDVKEATKAPQPPYLFKSGDTLLAMTEKYNVRVHSLCGWSR